MKRIIAILLCGVITAMALCSCQLSEVFGNGEDTTTAGSADTTTSSPADTAEPKETVEAMDFTDVDMSKYIKLGEYVGIDVTLTVEKLTDEKYQKAIEELLNSKQYYEQIKDRAVEKGDTVNADFKGFMDGVEFQGGTAQDQTILVTDNSGYIEGFAEGIIGAKAGETVKVELNFPEDYYEDLAGKPVTFEITVNYIHGELKTPEMNDEFVSKYTDGEYKTVAEFETYYREKLQEGYEETAKGNAISAMWDKFLESCEVIEYPEQQVNFYYHQQMSQCEYYAQSYGMTVDQVMSIMGWTEEILKENARLYTKGDLALNAISQKDNVGISEDEYLAGLAKYAASAGVDPSVLESYYGKDYIMDDLLWDKVLVSIYERATITRVEE